jgi:hypothetical protein
MIGGRELERKSAWSRMGMEKEKGINGFLVQYCIYKTEQRHKPTVNFTFKDFVILLFIVMRSFYMVTLKI